MSIYTDNDFKNRGHYIRCLASDYGVDLDTVWALADLLGPEEDFDGLVVGVEDASWED